MQLATEATYVIGIDAGGSSTRGILLQINSTSTKIVNTIQIPIPGNPHVNGLTTAITSVTTCIHNLIKKENVSSITIALSGGDDSKLVQQLKTNIIMKDVNIDVIHDVAAPVGLLKRNEHPICIVLVAGTGSIVASYNKERKLISRIGGRGPLLGDKGSAYDISRNIISNAISIYDTDKGNKDAINILRSVYREFLNENENEINDDHVNSLVSYIHSQSCTRDRMASLTGALFLQLVSSSNKNKIVIEQFKQATDELTSLLKSILFHNSEIEQNERIPVLLVGGVFQACDILPEFQQQLKSNISSLPFNNIQPYRVTQTYANALGAALYFNKHTTHSATQTYLQPF